MSLPAHDLRPRPRVTCVSLLGLAAEGHAEKRPAVRCAPPQTQPFVGLDPQDGPVILPSQVNTWLSLSVSSVARCIRDPEGLPSPSPRLISAPGLRRWRPFLSHLLSSGSSMPVLFIPLPCSEPSARPVLHIDLSSLWPQTLPPLASFSHTAYILKSHLS